VKLGRDAAFVAAVSLIAACSTVLGFEDASLDPLYAPPDSGIPNGGSGGAGGGSGGGGKASTSTTGSGGGAPGVTCQKYCDTIMANCNLANRQYESMEACLGVCALLPPGNAADPTGNTLACRYAAAVSAGNAEAELTCPVAGPGGDGQCGTNCAGYCAIFMQVCAAGNWFSSYSECERVCAGVPDPPGYNVSPDNQKGDSVNCRLYHVSAACLPGPTSADFHCPHAAADNVCVVGGDY